MFKTIANICVIVHTFGIKVLNAKSHTLLSFSIVQIGDKHKYILLNLNIKK